MRPSLAGPVPPPRICGPLSRCDQPNVARPWSGTCRTDREAYWITSSAVARFRDGEAEGFGGLEVDNQHLLGGELYWQFAHLRPS
jgi:hypothetical protein